MKSMVLSLFLLLLNAGLIAQVNDSNRHIKGIYLNNKTQIVTLNGLPISFYINHPRIDENAKKFYKGELSFSKDLIPYGLLDSLLTQNTETRPFYFFIFNQIVNLSNGQMVDIVASRCVEFVEKYPCDFFNSFNQNDVEINVVKWTTYIGANLKDRNSYATFKNQVDSRMKGNCSDVYDLLKSFLAEVRMCLSR